MFKRCNAQGRLSYLTFSIFVLVIWILLAHTLMMTTNLPSKEPITLHDKFKAHVEKHGTKFHNIIMGGSVETSRCVMVAATGPNYTWTLSWAENRRREGVPFVLVEMSGIRNGELIDIWARVPALMAAKDALPGAELLVYSDVDVLLNWPYACDMASERAMTITYKPIHRGRAIELQAGWLIVRTKHYLTDHLLNTWYYKGRFVHLQDQTVLNELYK